MLLIDDNDDVLLLLPLSSSLVLLLVLLERKSFIIPWLLPTSSQPATGFLIIRSPCPGCYVLTTSLKKKYIRGEDLGKNGSLGKVTSLNPYYRPIAQWAMHHEAVFPY